MSERINTHELLRDIASREISALDYYQKIASEHENTNFLLTLIGNIYFIYIAN